MTYSSKHLQSIANREPDKSKSGVTSFEDKPDISAPQGKGSDPEKRGERVQNEEYLSDPRSVEAFHRVLYHSGASGRFLLITIIFSLSLTMFVYALDGGITSQFDIIAASSFSRHAQVGAVNTASTLINGISKPLVGKLADLTSRPTTYVIVLLFYAVGYVIAASCTNFVAYVVGVAFTAVGKAGINLLCIIIIGDLTSLQWRGFWASMVIAPYLVTTFITGFISDGFIHDKWRWGLGMFAIMIPVLLTPAIWTLYVVQRRAKKLVLASGGTIKKRGNDTVLRTAWKGLVAVDLPGLILLGFAFSLILLPLSLAESADGGWDNPSMIAMEVVGFVVLILFIAYETWLAPQPIMARRIIKNKVFLAALGSNLFDQLTTAVGNNYFSSYIYVIKDWPNYNWTVFVGTATLCLTVYSLIGGLLQVRFHRYKNQMVFGAVLKVVGYAVFFDGNMRSTKSTAVLAIGQILQGASALTALGSRVGAMASVPHEDMASIIAAYFLWTYVGTAAGYAIASAIWTDKMLGFMREETPPGTSEKTLKEIYGSIKILHSKYKPGDPIRDGAVRAYTRTNGIIYTVAAVVSVLALVCSLLMPSMSFPLCFSFSIGLLILS